MARLKSRHHQEGSRKAAAAAEAAAATTDKVRWWRWLTFRLLFSMLLLLAGWMLLCTASKQRSTATDALLPLQPLMERTVLRQTDSYPHATVLREVTAVLVRDGLLDASECEHVMSQAKPLMKDAVVSGDGAGYKSVGRSNSVAWLPHDKSPTIWRIVQRLSEWAGIQSSRAESVQVIRYSAGQRYNPHFDAYDKSTARGQRVTADGGNRVLTILVYLSKVAQGGGTEFKSATGGKTLVVEPKMGRAVAFHNCEHDGNHSAASVLEEQRCYRPHPASQHAGLPVEEGEKWAMNLWVREFATKRGMGAYNRQLQKLSVSEEL